jgi:hypothetical protein
LYQTFREYRYQCCGSGTALIALIRIIFGKLDPDPSQSGKLDPDLDPYQSEKQDPVHIKVKRWKP